MPRPPPPPPPGLNWQPLILRFEGSLETKQDARISAPPDFDLLRDAHFEEIGALQTRPPFGAVMGSGAIFGGGSLSNCRKLATVNGELCVFTDTGLYSWNVQLSQWVLRGTHLAVSVDETPRFVTSGDQLDADRAELNGTIVYAWTEGAGTAASVYAAAIDKTTGAVLTPTTAISPAATFAGRPRLVALATKILLFADDGTSNLTVRAIDPANPAAGFASVATNVLAGVFFGKYDVVRVDGTDQCVGACNRTPNTSYTVFTVTSGLAVATATKARTCDGPIAVANISTTTQIVRENGTNIQGDLVTTSTLADVFTNQSLSTTALAGSVNQITLEYQTATTAVAYWTGASGETSGPNDFTVQKNTVSTANVVGTQATLKHQLGIASRAFAYGGHVYVWLVFASDSGVSVTGNTSAIRAQLQNTYFLYREDGLLVSQCVRQIAGGFHPSGGVLPGVQLVSGSAQFAWCATSRRRIEVGAQAPHTSFGARSPQDVVFTFDSNNARRTAQAGRTLYVASSIPLQYDGQTLAEVGFLIAPWYFEPTLGAAGNLGAGTYTWIATMRWRNAQGEIDRSTTATGMQLAVSASKFVFLNYQYLYVTFKAAPRPPSIDMWRCPANGPLGAPFYLVTSQDPNAGIVNNGYVANQESGGSLTPLPDNFADATLTNGKETWPENGDALEFMAPVGHSMVVPSDDRLYIAGLGGDDTRIAYSRARDAGEVASFHEANTADVPPVGGAITALWFQDGVLYVGRQTAIYALPGAPLDNTGQGQGFGPAQIVSLDVGPVSHEAQCLTPIGTLFKSAKGWYVMDRGRGLRYVGGEAAAFDSDAVLSMAVMTAKHQVRILTDQRLLVWDYRGLIAATSPGPGRWAEWTITGGLDATLYNDVYTILTATGPKQESASFTGLTYGLDAALAFIKPADLMGAVAVRRVQPLGEYRSAHLLRLRMYYNYDDSTVVDDVVWNPSPTVVGGPLQFSHGPKRRKCESFKVRLTAVAAGAQATLATASGLSHVVATSGTNWAATFAAKTGNYKVIGELGNAATMSITFTSGSPNVVDVRDHFSYDASTGLWSPDLNNVGVHVTCAAGSLTVAALETAIAAATDLIQVTAADATPTKTIDAAAMNGVAVTGSFVGGTFTAPTGEALKLTGIGLEVGIASQGLYKRLPGTQKA